MSDAQSPTDPTTQDGTIDHIQETADELTAVLADEDRERARELVRELADDLDAFDGDRLWAEIDNLREIREGIEPAPGKDVGDLHASGIIRTSDLSQRLAILQCLMEGAFKDDCSPVHFGTLTLRPKHGDVWSVEASGEELEYVNATAYETASELYGELWRLDRLVRLFDSRRVYSSSTV